MEYVYGKCDIENCFKQRQHKTGKFCAMHLARVRRHGYPELKRDHALERLPHDIDDFIADNCTDFDDIEIAKRLKEMGYKGATVWTVGYRRRKLGKRKYLRGEVQKHKAWVRAQAIKKYGDVCELCGYGMAVDTHHILPKHMGGPHETDNLMVICPNCHALITRRKIVLNSREEIPVIRETISKLIKKYYEFL